MPTNRKNTMRGVLRSCAGFTLIELIIVIGLIGALTAILLGQFTGLTESARATECLTHLRNLGMAVQSCGMTEDYYPAAGDSEYYTINASEARMYYHVHKGFVSRYKTPNPYRGDGATSHQNINSPTAYGDGSENDEIRLIFCVTNGALWQYGAKRLDEYVCPSHRLDAKKSNIHGIGWSYVMNSYFGYDWSRGSKTTAGLYRSVKYGNCKRPDRRLLFAELPWNVDTNPQQADLKYPNSPSGTENNPLYDGVLQYDDKEGGDAWSGTPEWIGFNHWAGKEPVAHVCFADGHTEKLRLGSSKKQDIVNLTAWLCQADDVQYNKDNGINKWEWTHKTEDE